MINKLHNTPELWFSEEIRQIKLSMYSGRSLDLAKNLDNHKKND